MAALLPVSMFLYAAPGSSRMFRVLPGLRVFLSSLPAIGALYVAGSRTRDYWHNFADVLAGSVLGAVVAVAVYRARFVERGARLGKHGEVWRTELV